MADNTNDPVRAPGDSPRRASGREDPPKITSVEKTKDPRRVAAGKRLAEISKAAKEEKMRERIESEANDRSGWGLPAVVGLLGVSIATYSLYYRIKQDNLPPPTPKEPIQHVVIEKRKLDNFDE